MGLIDLYPTLRSLCGLPAPPQQLDGQDLTPLLADPSEDWSHPAITTYRENKFSVRSEQWRYICYPNGTEELYDHRSDPHEIKNLADEPDTAPVRDGFRSLIPETWVPSLGGRNG